MKKVCVFYYSAWSSSIRDRLITTQPKYVVPDIGTWRTIPNSDIILVQNSGVTLLAYIPAGGLRGFIWNAADTTDKTPTGILSLIDQAVSKGFKGIFFDEAPLMTPVLGQTYQDSFLDINLPSPGSGASTYNGFTILSIVGNSRYNPVTAEAWKGLTCDYFISYAKSKGLFVLVNIDDNRASRIAENIWSHVDAVLTDENYNGRTPVGVEITHTPQCFVLSYSGVFSAQYTISAINYGFGAAYDCESMDSLSTNFETYMAFIPDSGGTRMITITAILKEKISGNAVSGKIIAFSVTGQVTDSFTGITDASGSVVIQKTYSPGNYSIVGSVSSDTTYTALTSEVVPFTIAKLDLSLTITIV